MLSQELLNILCCPKCHGKLEYNPTQETLTCSACHQVYAVKNGIPIMLIDNLPSQPASDATASQR